MKTWILAGMMMGATWCAFADPLTLVNALPSRPVFTLESNGLVVTRTVAPGSRVQLEPGVFSGLGRKELPLLGGGVYYLAHLAALPNVYQLTRDQALVLNQAGRPVEFWFGERSGSVVLASGTLALGEPQAQAMTAHWNDGLGHQYDAELAGGTVYRLLLASPEGIGTAVVLTPWD